MGEASQICVLSGLVKGTTEAIIEKASKGISIVFSSLLRKIGNKKIQDKIQSGEIFREYLNNVMEDCIRVKPPLRLSEHRNILEVYEPLDIAKGDKVRISSKDIENVLALDKKLIISGIGGTGKSTLIKYLVIDALLKNYLPVLIELKKFNKENLSKKDYSIKDYIYEHLSSNGLLLERGFFEETLELGKYVFFFDGYDEVLTAKKNDLRQALTSFSRGRNRKNAFIVSSRPEEENFDSWPGFLEAKCCGLTKEQANSLIKRIISNECQDKEKFVELYLNTEWFKRYKTFASIPLLLLIMFVTYKHKKEIPEKLNLFYTRAFDAMFMKHDRTKGYEREKFSKLSLDEFRTTFALFCYHTFLEGKTEFEQHEIINFIRDCKKAEHNYEPEDFLKDLTDCVCMVLDEAVNFHFTHRSFQEYFAAYHINTLPKNDDLEELNRWIDRNLGKLQDSHGFLKMLYELDSKRFLQKIVHPKFMKLSSARDEKVLYKFIIRKFVKDDDVSFDSSDSIGNFFSFVADFSDIFSEPEELETISQSEVESFLSNFKVTDCIALNYLKAESKLVNALPIITSEINRHKRYLQKIIRKIECLETLDSSYGSQI